MPPAGKTKEIHANTWVTRTGICAQPAGMCGPPRRSLPSPFLSPPPPGSPPRSLGSHTLRRPQPQQRRRAPPPPHRPHRATPPSLTRRGVMAGAGDDAGMDAVQKRLMFEDECILVDEQDNVVGHESKYNCHLWEKIESENLLHRAFSVFLFNSKYELLLQQRSATKVTFPLVWTNTCCSHPLYRESELIQENYLGVRNAAQRKLLDELGIIAEDVPVDQFTSLGRMLYKAPSDGKWGEHEVDYLLFIVRDVKLQLNPDEVADVKYVNREQLQELIQKADAGEDGLKLSPWFRLVVDNFLMGWWDHVEKGTLNEVVDMETIHKLK